MAKPELENAFSIEAAKGSSIAVLLLCSLSAASPLAAPAATLAVLGYICSVALDKLLTGRLCPLPISRISVGDGLAIVGALQGGEIDEQAQHLLIAPDDWTDQYRSREGMEVDLSLPTISPAQRTSVEVLPDIQVKLEPAIVTITTPPNSSEIEDSGNESWFTDPGDEFADESDDPWADDDDDDDDDGALHRGLPAVVGNQKCCVIYGNPGSGKGIQLSNAIRELKRLDPGVHVFGIDPKNDPKEDGYWSEGFDSLHRQNIAQMGANEAADWLYRKVAQFHMMSGPRLLVWDEAMNSMAAFTAAKGEKDYDENGKWSGQWLYKPGRQLLDNVNFWATSWVTSGDSRNIRAWFVTQSGNLDDLPFSGGIKSQLRQIILARDTDGPLIEKMGENRTLAKGKADVDHVRSICAESPVGRAIYLSDLGEWRPLAELPNLSGWNRDKQKNSEA